MICTFFGHKDTPDKIHKKLHDILIYLIEEKGVNVFYVGNQGNFDFFVIKELRALKTVYPQISYYVVLAYLPTVKSGEDYSDTILPDGIEKTIPKYAICKRNEWMINKTDYVVVYVRYSTGGAAKYKELSEKKGKTVINLFDETIL